MFAAAGFSLLHKGGASERREEKRDRASGTPSTYIGNTFVQRALHACSERDVAMQLQQLHTDALSITTRVAGGPSLRRSRGGGREREGHVMHYRDIHGTALRAHLMCALYLARLDEPRRCTYRHAPRLYLIIILLCRNSAAREGGMLIGSQLMARSRKLRGSLVYIKRT